MSQSPLLSVSIPTHNNRAVLIRCLESWKKHAAGSAVEIVVIEDGCTDGTADFLRYFCARPQGGLTIRWVHEPNVHELVCTNRGFKETVAPLVLVWQDDMFLETPWLVPELIRTFNRYHDLGVLCLSRGLNCLPCDAPIASWEDLHDGSRLQSTIGPSFFNWFFLKDVDIVIRPWVIRRACLDAVGPLDEAYRPTEWDEADLCYRIRQSGRSVAIHAYERCGAYTHLGSSTLSHSFSEAYKNRVLLNGRRFFERWEGRIRQEHPRPRPLRPRCLVAASLAHAAKRALRSLFRSKA